MSSSTPEYIDTDVLSNTSRSETVKTVAVGTCLLTTMFTGATGVVLGAAQAPRISDVLHVANHEASPTELAIMAAIYRASGRLAFARCVDPKEITTPEEVQRGVQIEAKTQPILFKDDWIDVRVSRVTCDNIEAFIHDPSKLNDDKLIAESVTAIAHESQHIETGIGDLSEGTIQCRAIQETAEMALLLGATPQQAANIANTSANSSLNVYTIPDGCYDGGALDVHPDYAGGFFPKQEYWPEGTIPTHTFPRLGRELVR